MRLARVSRGQFEAWLSLTPAVLIGVSLIRCHPVLGTTRYGMLGVQFYLPFLKLEIVRVRLEP